MKIKLKHGDTETQRRHKNIFTLLIFSLITSPCLCVSVVKAEEASSDPSVAQEETAAQEIWNFSLSGYDPSGKKRWEVNGNTASVLSDEKIELQEVKATSFNSIGSISVSSKSGVFDKLKNDVHLEENVVGKTSDGAILRTETMDYKAETGKIQTESFVEVEQESMKTFGYGAEAHPDEKKIALKKNITIIAKPSTTITCEGPLEIDYKNQIATLKNGVRVVDSQGEIMGDWMEVYFDRNRETITKLIAMGNVRITQGGNVTYSERAEYDVALGKVTLTENPQLQVIPSSTPPVANESVPQVPAPSASTQAQ